MRRGHRIPHWNSLSRALAAVALLSGMAGPAPIVAEPETRSSAAASAADLEAIDAFHDVWSAAIARGDVDDLMEQVTEDCVFAPSMGSTVTGREELRQLYGLLFSEYDLIQTFVAKETIVAGDLALVWGLETLQITPKGGGPSSRIGDRRAVIVLRRQASGRWLLARSFTNESTPPRVPAPAAPRDDGSR